MQYHQPKPNQPAEPANEPRHIQQEKRLETLSLILVTAVVLALIYFGLRSLNNNQPPQTPTNPPETSEQEDQISITEQTDSTSAYNIEYPLFAGSDEIIDIANERVDRIVREFKQFSNSDRANAVAEFGELPIFLKNPYQLSIKGEYLGSDDSKSIVLLIYRYSGGANGNSYYDIITFVNDREIDSLGQVVDLFDTATVKDIVVTSLEKQEFDNQLGSQVLSPSALRDLKLDQIEFSLDNDNLYLYFDEYQIGPGVLGSFINKIDRDTIDQYLNFSLAAN